MAVVRVIDKDGKLLAPTTRCDHVRHLLKEGKAKVVGQDPFTIQLTDQENSFYEEVKGKKKMSKKKRKNMVIAVAMIAVLAVAGISAYFTATDSETNTFVMGNISITQDESAFPDAVADQPKNVTPNQEIEKNPTVTNSSTSDNDAYVFTVVAVPKKVVKVAQVSTGSGPSATSGTGSNPGIDGTEQLTQLFQLNATKNATTTVPAANLNSDRIGHTTYGVVANASKGITANMPTKSVNDQSLPVANVASNANQWSGVDTWSSSWYLLDVNGEYSDTTESGVNSLYTLGDYTDDYNIYLFAYGSASAMTALSKGSTTPELFQSVTIANVINANDLLGTSDEDNIDYDANIEGTMPQILVKSFAIQADNIADNTTNTVAPAAVWAILNEQDGAYRAVADEIADMNAANSAWQTRTVDSHNTAVGN